MPRIATIAASLIICLAGHAVAGEMQPPRLTRATVDWDGAAATLADIPSLQSVEASAATPAPGSAIRRLTAASAERLPAIAHSGVPMLLPFDAAALLRDRAADTPPDHPEQSYFLGFGTPVLLDAGPAGYDAEFRFPLAGIPELANIRFSAAAQIHISGSRVTYELDPPVTDKSVAVPALDADFPGITRSYLENNVRYTFTRFGVPYVVSTDCFDGRTARFRHMACRDAHRVIAYFLKSLRLVGGAPAASAAAQDVASHDAAPHPIERPTAASPAFTYYAPGRLAPGTDRHGVGGRADDTVYAALRFPLADAPAFANTQLFKRRVGRVAGYPWRDNFCERRAFYVDQCPGGLGHQGQDLRAADCSPTSTGDDRCTSTHNDVVAARDGIIMRAPGQEAVYLIVDTATEHLRLRYLHMRPKLLDANGVLSGRRVKAGEVIGQIGNYSGHENGTSYHLHFDIQVPTRAGWVFVNPYMTLVAAYERLIGARGEEVRDDVVASAAPTTINDAIVNAITLASVRRAILSPTESAVDDIAPAAPLASPCTRSWRHRHCEGGHAAASHDDRGSTHSVRYSHHGARAMASHRSRSRHRL